jgi:hypothetical protein
VSIERFLESDCCCGRTAARPLRDTEGFSGKKAIRAGTKSGCCCGRTAALSRNHTEKDSGVGNSLAKEASHQGGECVRNKDRSNFGGLRTKHDKGRRTLVKEEKRGEKFKEASEEEGIVF